MSEIHEPKPSHSTAEVITGFVLGIGLIVVCTALLFWASFLLAGSRGVDSAGFWILFGFGVSQIIYMVPAILIARRRGRMGIAKGLIIAASLAFLLNASCFVLLWSGKMRIGG